MCGDPFLAQTMLFMVAGWLINAMVADLSGLEFNKINKLTMIIPFCGLLTAFIIWALED